MRPSVCDPCEGSTLCNGYNGIIFEYFEGRKFTRHRTLSNHLGIIKNEKCPILLTLCIRRIEAQVAGSLSSIALGVWKPYVSSCPFFSRFFHLLSSYCRWEIRMKGRGWGKEVKCKKKSTRIELPLDAFENQLSEYTINRRKCIPAVIFRLLHSCFSMSRTQQRSEDNSHPEFDDRNSIEHSLPIPILSLSLPCLHSFIDSLSKRFIIKINGDTNTKNVIIRTYTNAWVIKKQKN